MEMDVRYIVEEEEVRRTDKKSGEFAALAGMYNINTPCLFMLPFASCAI
jgi:hypothetical protein